MTTEAFLTAPVGANATSLQLSSASILPAFGTYTIQVEGDTYTPVSVSGNIVTVTPVGSTRIHNQGAVVNTTRLTGAGGTGGAETYAGNWNASTNVPALVSGVGIKGTTYYVSVAGTTSIDGNAVWSVGDSITFDGSRWDKIGGVPILPITQGGTGIGSSTALQATLSNATSILLPKARAALAKVLSSSGNMRVLFAGDSTGFGAYSNAGLDTGDLAKNSITAQLAAQFLLRGIPVSENAFAGGGNNAHENRLVNDGRISFTGGWIVSAGVGAAGGALMSTPGAGTLSFTPRTNCDSFKFWYAKTVSSGVLSWDLNGGAATNITTTGANALTPSATITGSLGANTLNIKYVSGGSVFNGAIEAWDSTKSQVIFMNAGAPITTSGDWTSNLAPFSALQAVPILAGDLIFLSLGINDWNTSVSPATYFANMQALITAWKASADIVLVTPAPSSIASVAFASQQAIIQQMYNLANANGLLLVDNFGRFVSYEVSNPLGLYGQALHPNQNGYAEQARGICNALLS